MSRISKTDRQAAAETPASSPTLYASRVRIYPKAVHGPGRMVKWAIMIPCLTLYYVLPWVRWYRGPGQPDQAVLLDVSTQRFYFFNTELWPQDIWLLAGLLIMGAVTLFLVTSVVGRVWCGYACPQTVWTDLFMWIERAIEGDRAERMARDAARLTSDTLWKKFLKHWAWIGVSFWTGGAAMMYFTDAPTMVVDFWTLQAPTPVYFFTALFTATTYVLAGWAREQVCTFMCPWPRFQAAMLDDQSFTVTYQSWRGEPRMRGSKKHAPGTNTGDCVDCGLCVQACPTGVDIRDGIQLECINCGLCMDACNTVMKRLKRPKGLITWDTLSRQAAKAVGRHEPIHFFRPRTLIYVGVLAAGALILTVAMMTRSTFTISVQRDRAPIFVTLQDGSLRNGYTLKVANKLTTNRAFDLTIKGLPGALMTVAEASGKPDPVLRILTSADQVETLRLLVTARPEKVEGGSIPVDFILRDTATGTETVYHSTFMGPAGYSGGTRSAGEAR